MVDDEHSLGSSERHRRGESQSARDFIREAWAIGCRTPDLFPWKILGDLVRLFLRPAGIGWGIALLAAGYGIGLRSAGQPLRALAGVEPVVLASGVGGLIFVYGLAGVLVDSVVGGGVFETIARDLERSDSDSRTGVFGRAGTGFLRVVGLQVCVAAARLALTVVGAAAAVAILYGFLRLDPLREASLAVRALFIAAPAFLYFALTLLVRAALRIAAAPLFLERTSVGEAMYTASGFVLEHFSGIYRIFARVAGLLLVPLLGYWALAIGAGAWGLRGPLGPLLEGLQIVGQIVLIASLSIAALLFDGAIFAYYAQTTGRTDVADDTADEEETPFPGFPESPYDETTTLQDLLPNSSTRVRTVTVSSETEGD